MKEEIKIEDLGPHSSFEEAPFEKMGSITEKFFGTYTDQEQIPITIESRKKLKNLSKYGLNCALDSDGNPVSWVVVVPTSVALMDQFIKGEINEREMFDRSLPSHRYEAIYLCSAFTIPEYRKKGIAKVLMLQSIHEFQKTNPEIKIFAWVWSEDGKKLINSLDENIGNKIELRK